MNRSSNSTPEYVRWAVPLFTALLLILQPAANAQNTANLINSLSATQQRERIAAARELGQASESDRQQAFRALVDRFAVEDKAGVRIALLRSIVKLQSDPNIVVDVVTKAQKDGEATVREEAARSAGRAFIRGTPELADAIFPLVSSGSCDNLPVEADSEPASANHLLANIKHVLLTLELKNGMDQCVAKMVKSYLSRPPQSLELLGTLPNAKDKAAALLLALEIVDGCRSDPSTYPQCLACAKTFQMSIAGAGISDPGFLENSRHLNSAIDDIEATVTGRKIPRTIRRYVGLPIVVLPLLGMIALIILSALLIRRRERKVHALEIDTIKADFSRQLDELGHSAQLEAARSALKHFTPPPPALRRNNIEVAGRFHQGVGVHGDFFNWYTTNDGDTWLYLVDVEGRGFLAAITSTLIRHVLDSTLESAANADPQKVLTLVDRQFENYGTTRDLAATMNLLQVSTSNKTLQLANAGMPAPLMFRYGQAQPDPIQAAGVYVGSGYSHYKIEPALAKETIGIGDLIVAFSDGVIEARNSEGTPWGVGGLSSQVMRYRDAGVEEIATKIIAGVTDYSGTETAQDDQCVVVIRIGNNPERRREESAPTIDISWEGTGVNTQVGFTIVNSIDAVHEIRVSLQPTVLKWAQRVMWGGDIDRLRMGVFEAILNSLRHAAKMGDRVRVTFRTDNSTAVVELHQPSEWRDWDKSLGTERRAFVASVAELKPEMAEWGTLLMLWYSDSLEVLRQGRLIRMNFSQKWRKGEK
jgi:sigma-B regulation protein RsbU (phosphoserine phosphatase)